MIGSLVKHILAPDDTHRTGMFCCMTTNCPASACAPLQRGHRGGAAAFFFVPLCVCGLWLGDPAVAIVGWACRNRVADGGGEQQKSGAPGGNAARFGSAVGKMSWPLCRVPVSGREPSGCTRFWPLLVTHTQTSS